MIWLVLLLVFFAVMLAGFTFCHIIDFLEKYNAR
jgi:hypothetical protein